MRYRAFYQAFNYLDSTFENNIALVNFFQNIQVLKIIRTLFVYIYLFICVLFIYYLFIYYLCIFIAVEFDSFGVFRKLFRAVCGT